jgi:hypothetical protein
MSDAKSQRAYLENLCFPQDEFRSLEEHQNACNIHRVTANLVDKHF